MFGLKRKDYNHGQIDLIFLEEKIHAVIFLTFLFWNISFFFNLISVVFKQSLKKEVLKETTF